MEKQNMALFHATVSNRRKIKATESGGFFGH